jgi:hypothetical protein
VGERFLSMTTKTTKQNNNTNIIRLQKVRTNGNHNAQQNSMHFHDFHSHDAGFMLCKESEPWLQYTRLTIIRLLLLVG